MSELPLGWAWTTLGEICSPVSKVDPRLEPEVEFTYIDIGGIDGLRIAETKGLTGSQAPSRARQLVRAGDTVLSTVRTYLRKTALVPPELDGAVASTGFCVLRPTDGVDARYVFHRVTAHDFVSRLTPLQTGSSYPAVRDRDVFAQVIELPPLNEQQRIVAAIEEHLSRLDAADASLVAARRRLDFMPTATLSEALRDVSNDVRLADVAEVRLGRQRSPKNHTGPNMRPYLRAANVTWNGLSLSDVKSMNFSPAEAATYELMGGDVLLSEASGSADEVGKPAVWRDQIDGCCFQNTLIRVRSRGPDPDYLHKVFLRDALTGKFAEAAPGVGIHHLGSSRLSEWSIPLPPLEEQRRIVQEVEERLSRIDAMRASIERAQRRSRTLRAAILERAFRGELVPQDPADEPAETLLARIRAEKDTQKGRRTQK